MTYTFDINAVDIVDLNGEDLRGLFVRDMKIPFEKIIGNLLYTTVEDIDLADKARDIHKGRTITLTEREKPMFIEAINKSNYTPFIKRQIIKEIKEVVER